MRIRHCVFCNGTGIDDTDWSGRCPFCDGHGEVEDRDDGPDSDSEPDSSE